jgi:hypothetical protein
MRPGKATVRLPKKIQACLFLAVAMLICTASEAYAYIDPGYGPLLWQLAVAGFVGVMFYYRQLVARLTAWFKTIVKSENKNG